MIERIETVYQWLSPITLSIAGGMVYAGCGPLDSAVQGWTAVVFWGICGGFATCGLLFSVLALYTAQQHVRVTRARILQHRRRFTTRHQTGVTHGEFNNSLMLSRDARIHMLPRTGLVRE